MAISSYLDIYRYLELMVQQGGTDMFFLANVQVRMKLKGRLVVVGKQVLTAEMTNATAHRIMNERQRKVFDASHEVDFSIKSLQDDAHFRVNAYKQRGSSALVIRYIPSVVPELEDLKLPEILKSLSLKRNGLMLMTGGMGSGKTTTLSGMLNYRNQHQSGHILTIEDPLEYIHESKKSLFSHRELDLDTKSYAAALRSALRESPDVIMIGEVRDQETMQAVLEIANSGILAIATLHARNTYQALQRIISFFPPERHRELYLDLSLSLNCVLSQRLILDKNNQMLPVMEILLNNNLIAELIAQGKTDQIKAAMESTSLDGIQLFDVELLKLYKAGLVSLEEVLDKADSKVDMERQLNFG